MQNTFLISDTHFGHKGVTEFLRNDGSKLRPFSTVEEMDEALIENWNSIVRPEDKVYHLGDFCINRKALKIGHKLNGTKILIKGNHDVFRISEYLEFFKDIRAYHVLNGLIFSHIPVHSESMGRFGNNVHGHLHANRVMLNDEIDSRYFSVCVEHTNYSPMNIEEVLEGIKNQGGQIGFKTKGNN